MESTFSNFQKKEFSRGKKAIQSECNQRLQCLVVIIINEHCYSTYCIFYFFQMKFQRESTYTYYSILSKSKSKTFMESTFSNFQKKKFSRGKKAIQSECNQRLQCLVVIIKNEHCYSTYCIFYFFQMKYQREWTTRVDIHVLFGTF